MRTLINLLNLCPVPMVLVDKNDKAIFINNSFTSLVGYDLNDLPNVNHWFAKAYPNDELYRKKQEQVWKDACMKFREKIDFKAPGRPANVTCKDGSLRNVEIFGANIGCKCNLIVFIDASEKDKYRQEKMLLLKDLNHIEFKGDNLKVILPICSFCKKIRNDKDLWEDVDIYISKHSDAVISHSICRECAKKYYPDMEIYDE